MSPEMIHGNCFDPFKSDIWSLGMTMYTIITGRYTNVAYQTFEDYWEGIYNDCSNLGTFGSIIQRCLVMDPKERPTAHDIKELLLPLAGGVKRTSTVCSTKKMKKGTITSSLNPKLFARRCTIFVPRISMAKYNC